MRKRADLIDPVDQLKRAVAGNDEVAIFKAALAVGNCRRDDAVPLLLRLLRNDRRVQVKNGAAIALRDLRENAAVVPLIRLIEDVEYRDRRGTFVYALETLDWYSRHSNTIARLLTDPNYEVRSMAFAALRHAAPRMSRETKDAMAMALLLGTAAQLHGSGQLKAEIVETIEAAASLLAAKRLRRTLKPVLIA